MTDQLRAARQEIWERIVRCQSPDCLACKARDEAIDALIAAARVDEATRIEALKRTATIICDQIDFMEPGEPPVQSVFLAMRDDLRAALADPPAEVK